MFENQSSQLLILSCGNNYYAIPAEAVERVLRVVETTPVPGAPYILYGMFDLHGMALPVISLRRLFCLDEKCVELEDKLVVLYMGERLMAFLADEVMGVYACAGDEESEADERFGALVPNQIIRWEGHLVPVIDVERVIDEELFRHVDAHAAMHAERIGHV